MMYQVGDQYKTIPTTFICSEICGGKSTLTKSMVGNRTVIVEISSIVKKILQTHDREKLQNSSYLWKQICESVRLIAVEYHGLAQSMVVSGIRQLEIFHDLYGNEDQAIWIHCNEATRFQRYCIRESLEQNQKSLDQFNNACKKDVELGILLVKQAIFSL